MVSQKADKKDGQAKSPRQSKHILRHEEASDDQ